MLLNSGATGDINDGGTSSIIRDNITWLKVLQIFI
jgi:hypothetical protein